MVTPFLYRWLAGLSAEFGGFGRGATRCCWHRSGWEYCCPRLAWSRLATTLVIAGPAGLILYLGGSQRTGRILQLFWLLQLVLLASSVPTIYQAEVPRTSGGGNRTSFVSCCAPLSWDTRCQYSRCGGSPGLRPLHQLSNPRISRFRNVSPSDPRHRS